MSKVYLLNAPVLTSYGLFKFSPLSLEEAKAIVSQGEFISAIGHEATAKILSFLLGVEVPMNRIAIKMEKGDRAIVFRLLTRIEEGKVLSEEEIMKLPWELCLLEKIL